MALSEELKRIYTSAPAGPDYLFWECLSLYHSAFPEQSYHLVRNRTSPMDKNVEGILTTFQAFPFDFRLPSRNSNGTVDLEITISNLNTSISQVLEDVIAAAPEAIVVVFNVYIESSLEPQIDPPLQLTLSQVAVNGTTLVGTATRADVLNRAFPKQLFRPTGDTSYPGLDR